MRDGSKIHNVNGVPCGKCGRKLDGQARVFPELPPHALRKARHALEQWRDGRLEAVEPSRLVNGLLRRHCRKCGVGAQVTIDLPS